jgi:hypothetical protein
MTKLVADHKLGSSLKRVNEAVEVCDEQGATLGHFLPKEQYVRLLYDMAKSDISDDELQLRLQEPGGSTLAEIWKRLGRE